LEAGSFFALGFPAMRGSGTQRLEPRRQDESHHPRPADVLPLIRGGLDPRMMSLKQWIINAYVRSKDDRLGPRRERHATMIQKLFELLDDLTPGFDLRFHGCDTETFEVLLQTSDGVLPIEYVSQGMSATIGWVGLLLQRLLDVYADAENPERQHALLLIDEIDSHLHPEWQQQLVPKIKQHFPGLQVVASTHSVLLAGNLEAGELTRIRRIDGKLTVEPLQHSFKGYRFDQILTDKPFGMSSARSTTFEDARQEYAELLGKSVRSGGEEQRFGALVDRI
jgi:predicted ATP-binding protein involved in virulence